MIAENIFSCDAWDNPRDMFAAEVEGVRELMMAKMKQESAKRTAKDLITETPHKVKVRRASPKSTP